MPPTLEHALIQSALAGSEAAYADLYHANQGNAFRYCLRLTRRWELAEDLLQDSFIHAFEHLKQFRLGSKFSTWLHRIILNNFLMSRRRRQLGLVSLDDVTSNYLPSFDPTTAVLARLTIHTSLPVVTEKLRTALVLHELDGYTHEDIAHICGVTKSCSKSRLNRAKKLLRTEIERKTNV